MKKTMILAGLVATASLNAAVIEQVIVRQQWPWSTDVKVEYKVTGVTSPVNIAVRAFNGNEELDSVNADDIVGKRTNTFGAELLMLSDRVPKGFVSAKAGIEDIMLMIIKNEAARQQ